MAPYLHPSPLPTASPSCPAVTGINGVLMSSHVLKMVSLIPVNRATVSSLPGSSLSFLEEIHENIVAKKKKKKWCLLVKQK